MITHIQKRRPTLAYRILSAFISFTFIFSVCMPPASVYAQLMPSGLNLPLPGAMVSVTSAFAPVMIKGVNIHPDNPLKFDFIIDRGDTDLQGVAFEEESAKLIKYFMASLTVPEDEMWVNLSPYEKDRIIPENFGHTEMGRDLLAQDYLLKQLSASLMYPEDELGKKFWDRVYKKAYEQFGTTEIPMNTFNKIWIVPKEAKVYEHAKGAFVVSSYLNVMLEEDYLALESNVGNTKHGMGDIEVISGVSSQIVREVLIPEIEKEVNEGATFANLRQIYNSMILAVWYKQALKDSVLGQVYVDQNKTKGVDVDDKNIKEKIYNQYVEAFEKGVYNYIKEDYDPATQEMIPRKYFSGGTKPIRFEDFKLNPMTEAVRRAIADMDTTNVTINARPVGSGITEEKFTFSLMTHEEKINFIVKSFSEYKLSLKAKGYLRGYIMAALKNHPEGRFSEELFKEAREKLGNNDYTNPHRDISGPELIGFILMTAWRAIDPDFWSKEKGLEEFSFYNNSWRRHRIFKRAEDIRTRLLFKEEMMGIPTSSPVVSKNLSERVKEVVGEFTVEERQKIEELLTEKGVRNFYRYQTKVSLMGDESTHVKLQEVVDEGVLFWEFEDKNISYFITADGVEVDQNRIISLADKLATMLGLEVVYDLERVGGNGTIGIYAFNVKSILLAYPEGGKWRNQFSSDLRGELFSIVSSQAQNPIFTTFEDALDEGGHQAQAYRLEQGRVVRMGDQEVPAMVLTPRKKKLSRFLPGLFPQALVAYVEKGDETGRDHFKIRRGNFDFVRDSSVNRLARVSFPRSEILFDKPVNQVSKEDLMDVMETVKLSELVSSSPVSEQIERLVESDVPTVLKQMNDVYGLTKEQASLLENNKFAEIGFDGEANRMGWLPNYLEEILEDPSLLSETLADAENIREQYDNAVFIGMGGSGLGVDLIKSTFGKETGPRIFSLRTTDPATVVELTRELAESSYKGDLRTAFKKTQFVVISKTWTTQEVLHNKKYFEDSYRDFGIKNIANNFLFITDPDSKLDVSEAQRNGYEVRMIQLNKKSDIGGRNTTFTNINLLPLAIVAPDKVMPFLEEAREMNVKDNVLDDAFAILGVYLHYMATENAQRKDKITFLVPEELRALPMWAEQLIEESLGKDGKGISIVYGEDLTSEKLQNPAFTKDRIFLRFNLAGQVTRPDLEESLKGREDVFDIDIESVDQIGGLMLGLQRTVTTIAHRWDINFVNQPGVEGYKDATRSEMAKLRDRNVRKALNSFTGDEFKQVFAELDMNDDRAAEIIRVILQKRVDTKGVRAEYLGTKVRDTEMLEKVKEALEKALLAKGQGERVEIPSDWGYGTFDELKIYYEPFIEAGIITRDELEHEVQQLGAGLDDGAAVYAALINIARRTGKFELAEIASYGRMTPEVRNVLQEARTNIFTDLLTMASKLGEGPDRNHSFHQSVEQGPDYHLSTYLMPLETAQPKHRGYDANPILAQTIGTVRSLINAQRKVILISIDGKIGDSTETLNNFFSDVDSLLKTSIASEASSPVGWLEEERDFYSGWVDRATENVAEVQELIEHFSKKNEVDDFSKRWYWKHREGLPEKLATAQESLAEAEKKLAVVNEVLDHPDRQIVIAGQIVDKREVIAALQDIENTLSGKGSIKKKEAIRDVYVGRGILNQRKRKKIVVLRVKGTAVKSIGFHLNNAIDAFIDEIIRKFGLTKVYSAYRGVGDDWENTVSDEIKQEISIGVQYKYINTDDNLEGLLGEITEYVKGRKIKLIQEIEQAEVVSSPVKKGGIDLNPNEMDMQLERDGRGLVVPVAVQMIENLRNMNIEGFAPVIIHVAPITNLPLLLGLSTEETNQPFATEDQDSDEPTLPMALGLVDKYRNKYIRVDSV